MNIEIINLPKVEDYRGNLAIIEKDVVPFEIKRVYYLYDVPSNAYRGGHAHKILQQLIIAASGSFDLIVNDGKVFSDNSHTILGYKGFFRTIVCVPSLSNEFLP